MKIFWKISFSDVFWSKPLSLKLTQLLILISIIPVLAADYSGISAGIAGSGITDLKYYPVVGPLPTNS